MGDASGLFQPDPEFEALPASEFLNPRRCGAAGEHRVTSRKSPDWWITPREATEALCEREIFRGTIWEPACGDGAISKVLKSQGYAVRSSDLHRYGYGRSEVDFLRTRVLPAGVECIVTNPPFHSWTKFAQHALDLGTRKVVLFGRLGALSGVERALTLYAMHNRLARSWVFSYRLTSVKGGLATDTPVGRGGIDYCWYVWERHHRNSAQDWILPADALEQEG